MSRSRPSEFREMFAEISRSRELLWQMVLRDLRIRYKQAVMGFAWALLMPAAAIAAAFVVRFAMSRAAGIPFGLAAFSGMAIKALAWSFFIGALSFSANSLISNLSLVTKIYFPREVFPFSAVVTQSFDSLVGATLLGVVLFAVLGVAPSWTLAWVPLLLLLLALLTAAAALFFSCANVFFRDVKYLIQVVVMFGMFFTPVLYEPAQFGRTGAAVLMLNPLSPILEGLRLAIVEHHNLLEPWIAANGAEIWAPWRLVYAGAWSVLGFVGAWRLFHKLEFVFPEYI